jgi:hypothetical protein
MRNKYTGAASNSPGGIDFLAEPSGRQRKRFDARRVVLDMSAPQAAHAFLWARVGGQFLLEVGYVDLQVVGEIISKSDAEPAPVVDLYITDRFVLDVAGAERLLETADAIRAELEKFKKEEEAAHVK